MRPHTLARARIIVYGVLAVLSLVVLAFAGAALGMAAGDPSGGVTINDGAGVYTPRCGTMLGFGLLSLVFTVTCAITGFFQRNSIVASPIVDISGLSFLLVFGLGAGGFPSSLIWDGVPKATTYAGMEGVGWLLEVLILAWLIAIIVITIQLGKQWKHSWAGLDGSSTGSPDSFQMEKPLTGDAKVPLLSQQGMAQTYSFSADAGLSMSTAYTNPQYQQPQFQQVQLPQPQVQQVQYQTPRTRFTTQTTGTTTSHQSTQPPIPAQQQPPAAEQSFSYTQPFIQAQPSTFQPQEQTYIVETGSSRGGFTTTNSKIPH